jgi:hypothetical protein
MQHDLCRGGGGGRKEKIPLEKRGWVSENRELTFIKTLLKIIGKITSGKIGNKENVSLRPSF